MLKKKRWVQSKTYLGSTFKKDMKELDPRKAYKYTGIEQNHDIENNEKEKLKKEYLRRMRLV